MATMTAPPAPPSQPANDVLRHPNIYANLMPDEVLAARDARRLKNRVLVALAGLLGLLILLYFVSVIQTAHAKSELSSAQSQARTLRKQQQDYAPLVQAQSQAKAIRAQLAQLMHGDLQWKPLLQQLRQSPAGITPTSASMNITGTGAQAAGPVAPQATAGATGTGVLNATGKPTIGTLTIIGVANDKAGVASYVDYLSKVKGFAAPFPSSVTLSGGKYQFSISVLVTTDLLGGRYSQTTQGGK